MPALAGPPPNVARVRSPAWTTLQNQQFRWLYASNAAFFFAMNGQMVVRSYLAFKITNDSPFALGLINLAVAIPMLVISPIGGVIADRVERRRLILTGQALLILSEVTVFGLLVTGVLAFWHLMAIAVVMGCIFPFIMPARQAIVVDIVGKRALPNAMALQMAAMNAARVIAPVLAGFVIYLLGVKATYFGAVIVYGVALLAMTRVHRSYAPARPARATMYGDIKDGFSYVWHDPPVRVLMFLGLVPILLAMPFQMLLVVFAEDVWDVGSRGFGVLQAAAGLGGLAGATFLAFTPPSARRLRMMMSSLLGFGICLFAFAASPLFLLALPLVFVSDVFASVFQTINNTIIQTLIPDHVRGRVMSLMMMSFGLTPLGTVPISLVAQEWGAPVAVGGASVTMVIVSLAFYAFSRAFRQIDETARVALAGIEDAPLIAPTASPDALPAAAS
ncbi:MAG TPA: MFS transporter [Tepidiformaceae bacterium]|nr:MFS transporter [Tepidiformaceae bacterium]